MSRSVLVLVLLPALTLGGCSDVASFKPVAAPPTTPLLATVAPADRSDTPNTDFCCTGVLSADGKWRLASYVSQGVMTATLTKEKTKKTIRRVVRSKGLWAPGSNPLWLDRTSWVQLAFGERSLFAVVQGVNSPPRSIALGYPKGSRAALDAMQSELLGEIPKKRMLAIVSGDYWPEADNRRRINAYSFALTGEPHLQQWVIRLPPGMSDLGCCLAPSGGMIGWLLTDRSSEAPRAFFGINRVDSTDVELIAELLDWDKQAFSPIYRRFEWSSDNRSLNGLTVTDRTRVWRTTVANSEDGRAGG